MVYIDDVLLFGFNNCLVGLVVANATAKQEGSIPGSGEKILGFNAADRQPSEVNITSANTNCKRDTATSRISITCSFSLEDM